MTIPYNAKPYSNRSYIRDALLEKGIEIDKEDLTVTVQAVRDAMQKVVPGPMKVMKWIEDEVSKAIKRGEHGWIPCPTVEEPEKKRLAPINTELGWITPSGFVVNQPIMKKEKKNYWTICSHRRYVQWPPDSRWTCER